jgi:hypothetical protein
MAETPAGRPPAPRKERDWSPAPGPSWLLDRQRSLLQRDEPEETEPRRPPGLATRLLLLLLLVTVAVVMVLVVFALKAFL